MITWSEEEYNTLFISEPFKTGYREYCENNESQKKFNKFIQDIKLNTKYFRLTTNNKIGKNKRFRNKNISEDTLVIKEINSLLNKLTDKNIETINEKIKEKMCDKKYLSNMIIDNILHKSIIQPNYNTYYLNILLDIYSNIENLNSIIEMNVEGIYKTIKEDKIDENQSEYMQFCDKNKKLDLLIGHSLLITELEKKKIISNKIIPTLNELIEIIGKTEDLEEKYKCTQCLYNILKSYYGDSLLPQGFIDKLNLQINIEKSNKIKFKLMDMIERR
tara:strand:+ start:52 stop:876 length:825 start_codon:yes stop_codon:yes gene_type:complete